MKKFKFKTEPYEHQAQGFQLIKDEDSFALFMEQGTGKSKLVIDLLRYVFFKEKKVLKTLVVCPKIAVENWLNEFEIHSNSGDYAVVVKGTKARREKTLARRDCQIFIINFDSVPYTEAELLEKGFQCIIIDESQRIKAHKGKQARSLLRIANSCRISIEANFRSYLLSGTPMLNSPLDLFMQFLVLDGGKTFGTNFFAYRNTYFVDKNAGMPKSLYYPDFVLQKGALEVIRGKLDQRTYVRKKAECLDLPDKVYQRVYLEMDKGQARAYEEMVKINLTFFEENPVIAGTALTKLIRLNQITSGFVKTDDEGTTAKIIPFKTNPKLNAVKEMLVDLTVENKVIIWAVFRQDIFTLIKELKEYNPAVIFGDTKDKFGEQNKFKTDTTCRIMIANPQSAGLAINLIEASYAIYFSQGYSLEHRLQSEDRCHRIGSQIHDKITYIDLLFKGSVDEVVVDSLLAKKNLANQLIRVIDFLKGGENI